MALTSCAASSFAAPRGALKSWSGYRSGEFIFDNRTLIWEYPRQAPDWEQVDLVEVMELNGPRIAHHRIYWGWYGTPLLQPSR